MKEAGVSGRGVSEGQATRRHDAQAVERHLRRALVFALEQSPDTAAFGPLLGALGAIGGDWVDRLAYEMAATAVTALVHRTDETRAAVYAWHAHRHRCDNARPEALAILDIASAVDLAASLYRRRDEWLESKGRRAVEQLRAFLAERVGPTLPNVHELEGWIARHSPKGAHGKLTTAGIVTKIIHRGRLLGARGSDEAKTLRRVTMVLKRHRFTPLVK